MIKTQIHNLIFYSLFFHTQYSQHFSFFHFHDKKKKKKNFKENFYNSRTNKERIVKFLKKKKNPQFERKKVFPIFLNLKKKRFNYVKRKEKKKRIIINQEFYEGGGLFPPPMVPFIERFVAF